MFNNIDLLAFGYFFLYSLTTYNKYCSQLLSCVRMLVFFYVRDTALLAMSFTTIKFWNIDIINKQVSIVNTDKNHKN